MNDCSKKLNNSLLQVHFIAYTFQFRCFVVQGQIMFRCNTFDLRFDSFQVCFFVKSHQIQISRSV